MVAKHQFAVDSVVCGTIGDGSHLEYAGILAVAGLAGYYKGKAAQRCVQAVQTQNEIGIATIIDSIWFRQSFAFALPTGVKYDLVLIASWRRK